MGQNNFVSIIVPIYQVEKYISQCIESILSQTFQNFECILVDDGSLDYCPEICDRYAEKDARIQVIHKANGGLSDARNVGVSQAAGEYILFLDGDDYWDDENALQKLYDRAALTGADLINFSYRKFFEDTGEMIPYFSASNMPLGLELAEQLHYLADNGLYIASACNKLIRRSLLQDLAFEKGVFSEDIIWCLDLIAKAASADYIQEDFYCYRQRSHSITHVVKRKRCEDLANAIFGCLSRTETVSKTLRELFRAYTAFQYGTFILVQAQAQESQDDLIQRLAPHKGILKYHGQNKKLLCLNIASAVLGYKPMCKLIRAVYQRKQQ